MAISRQVYQENKYIFMWFKDDRFIVRIVKNYVILHFGVEKLNAIEPI